MFSLHRIVKRSVADTVPERASVHTRKATFGTVSAPKQDYFAQIFKRWNTCNATVHLFMFTLYRSVFVTLGFTVQYSVNKSGVVSKITSYVRKAANTLRVNEVDMGKE